MDFIIEFITANEHLVMVSLFSIVIVLLSVVIMMDVANRKRSVKSAKMLLSDEKTGVIDAFKEPLVDEPNFEYTQDLAQYDDVVLIKEDNSIVNEIKYVEEDEELEKTKAQLELKNLKEELLKAELEENNKVQQESATQEVIVAPSKEEIIDDFELKQEEDAIISLEELNKIGGRKYEENEITQYKDDGNEPISIQELENLYNKESKKLPEEEIITTIVKEPTDSNNDVQYKFKNSPIISPVFGIDNEETNLSLESTANLDKLSEEIRKTNEFLNALKELRKNLP